MVKTVACTNQKGMESKNPNKRASFKQRNITYMELFTLDVVISKHFVSTSLTHRVTSKQGTVAGTNSKDIRGVLMSRLDISAFDVCTASYTPRERDKFEGKIRAVVQSLINSGIDTVDT
ncbi:hypothetical protein EUGRSUZ_L00075 [Eucalyptus grandis]|uniref:Uncharacterized protein n=1 Tax=Eucalyptus grandis TaxID=71139 RepID=A0A058ZX61_EUCGR|nr:hypothetical protein EUGRSUZ_L00075 [Eucalyptus grandis]